MDSYLLAFLAICANSFEVCLGNFILQSLFELLDTNIGKPLSWCLVEFGKHPELNRGICWQKFFHPAAANIRLNNGSNAVSEEHIHAVCKQIFEEVSFFLGSKTAVKLSVK